MNLEILTLQPMLQWILGAAIALLIWLVLRVSQFRLNRYIKSVRETVPEAYPFLGTFLETTRGFFLISVGLYFGIRLPAVQGNLAWDIQQYIFLFILAQLGLWGNALIKTWARRAFKEREEVDAAQASAMDVLQLLAIIVLWIILTVAGLAALGLNVGTLVAGLGVGGIAIALASQKILSDLFASLTIILDKPFVVGDFIIVGDIMGNVKKIGLKTTRILSLGGEQLILPNSYLLESRIQNFQRMEERRNKMLIGVVYQTSLKNLKRIPEIIKEIIESQEQVRFDRAHFKEYGPYSLNFEIVYYALTRDYLLHMEFQQKINLALFERFKKDGIGFAYPTQTIAINNSPASD